MAMADGFGSKKREETMSRKIFSLSRGSKIHHHNQMFGILARRKTASAESMQIAKHT